MTQESAVAFECGAKQLVAVLHRPDAPCEVGVVVVVGGPQYRVGSHRQFVLLARDIARAGFACLRFDYRGMGDSDGQLTGFESVNEDVKCAVDRLSMEVPTVKKVVLWGLCDGATAAGFYAALDSRVCGIVLLNPWVRSDTSLARSLLFHYYVKRLFDARAWLGVLGNTGALKTAVRSFFGNVRKVAGSPAAQKPSEADAKAIVVSKQSARPPLAKRLGDALQSFRGAVLVILSTADITANEFAEAAKSERALRRRLRQKDVTQFRLADADHTFSSQRWRDRVSEWTCDWLRSQRGDATPR